MVKCVLTFESCLVTEKIRGKVFKESETESELYCLFKFYILEGFNGFFWVYLNLNFRWV